MVDLTPDESPYRGANLRRAVTYKFDWTDEKIEELKRLFALGEGATEIAKLLDPSGGLTRCAVSGKLFRMKLFRGMPGGARRSNKRKPAQASDHQSGTREGVVPRQSAPQAEPKEPEFRSTERNDLPPDQSDFAVSLLDARENQCRWPLNDPGAGFLFCGATTLLDCSYCARHYAIGHTRNTGRMGLRSPWLHRGERAKRRLASFDASPDDAVGRL